MTQIQFKFVAILLILGLASAQIDHVVNIMSYNPATGATVTAVDISTDKLRYMYRRDIAAAAGPPAVLAAWEIVSVRYNPASIGNRDVITYSQGTAITGVKAVSRSHTCAVAYDASTIKVIKFDTATLTASVIQDLVALGGISITIGDGTGATDIGNAALIVAVADDCAAIQVGTTVYHSNPTGTTFLSSSSTTAGTGAAWAGIVYNEDFNVAVGDTGIFKYTVVASPASRSYAAAGTFTPALQATNRRVWTNGNKLLVLSWLATTAPAYAYTVRAFVLEGSTYAAVGTAITGLYTSASAAPPSLTISQNFQNVIVSGEVSPVTSPVSYFATFRVFDYTAKTSADATIPAWMTATQSLFFVSDTFLYVRNAVDKTGAGVAAGTKQQAGYTISGTTLTLYRDVHNHVVAKDLPANMQRAYVLPARSGELMIVRQIRADAVTTVTLSARFLARNNQVFSFDRKFFYTASTITGANTAYFAKSNQARYFQAAVISTTQRSLAATWFGSDAANTQQVATLSGDQNLNVKAVSANYRCVLVNDGTAGTPYKTYTFATPGIASIVDTPTAAFVTALTGVVADTIFDVSDDCSAFRIGGTVYHRVGAAGSNNFTADTLPTNVTLSASSVFNNDFTKLITDTGIYSYNLRTITTAGSYTLDLNDTFFTTKRVEKNDQGYLVYSQRINTNATLRDWKLQLYSTIGSGSSTKFGQFTGTTNGDPIVLISPKLSKIIIKGTSATNASATVYFAKTVDYWNSASKDISLPTAISSINTDLSITDEFLFVRNSYSATKRQSAYFVMGGTLIQYFDQADFSITTNLQRVLVLPDSSVYPPRFILGYEYALGDTFRVIRNVRNALPDELNPGRVVPQEMIINNLPASPLTDANFRRQSFPNFGRWVYTTDTSPASANNVLNWVAYDTSVAVGKKKVNTFTFAGTHSIVAVSPAMDCVMTKTATDVFITQIVPAGSTDALTFVPAQSGVSLTSLVIGAGATNAAANIGAFNTVAASEIQVGNACFAFRVNNMVYTKTAASTYALSAASTTGAGLLLLSTSATTRTFFDASLNFAFVRNTGIATPTYVLYKYGSNTYAPIVSTGLGDTFSTVQIHANAANNKLILLSYQNGESNIYGSYVRSQIKVYIDSSGWTTGTLPATLSSFTTLINKPNIIANPLGDTIGVHYIGGTPEVPQHVVVIGKAGTSLQAYTNPRQFTQFLPSVRSDSLGSTLAFWAFDNYLYFLRTVQDRFRNRYTEFIYKIDKATTPIKLTEISRRQVQKFEVDNAKNLNIAENGGIVNIVSELLPAAGSRADNVFLVKGIVGTSAFQGTVRGIELRQSGLFVQGSNTTNLVVSSCIQGCRQCPNPTTCQEAMPGFTLDKYDYPLRCPRFCARCTLTAALSCIECLPGFYGNGGSCIKCHATCLTCTSNTAASCLTCRAGFYLEQVSAPSGACTACPENCVLCNQKSCLTCRVGYVYHPTLSPAPACVKCTSGCTNCKFDKINQCDRCAIGFEPVLTNGTITSCNPCPINCRTCTGGVCAQCRNSFRLVNNTCVARCRLPCRECGADPTACTSCIEQFTLNGSNCNANTPACNTNKTCTSCPFGWNLIMAVCYRCNAGANCRTCDLLNIESCTSCVKGFYPGPNGVCKACNDTGCATCDTEFTCSECKAGFTAADDFSGSLIKCIKCDDSCATCVSGPNNCETCATGFTKKGWACVNINNIAFSVKVNAQLATLTTENITAIQQAILDAVKRDRNQITFNDIRTGSVVFDATLNVDNINQQTTLVQQLQAALAVNSNLGGFPVLTSSVSATVGDLNQLKSLGVDSEEVTRYRNIAIVVGVVIPVGLIILFIIFFICYKKGVICADSGATKIRDGSMNDINVNNKESELGTMRH